MTLRQAAGQVLVVGLEGAQLSTHGICLVAPAAARRGHSLSPQHRERRADPCPAALGRQVLDHPLLRCIDVEGGTVDRLRDLIAPMPSPFAVAATNKPALFEKHGSLIGQEVRMLGLNTTFAPVLDLRTPASEAVMTTRVVSGDPEQVTRYARLLPQRTGAARRAGLRKAFPRPG